MGILKKHEELQAINGPFKPPQPDVKKALAELQTQLSKKDPTFKPAHDFRPKK